MKKNRRDKPHESEENDIFNLHILISDTNLFFMDLFLYLII